MLFRATFLALAVVSLQTGQTAAPAPPAQKPNDADVHFMSGMIPHHAQAVLIAGWAKTHTTNRQLQILCERIIVSQRDEIELMRNWLADRGLPVPPPDATHHKMKHGDMEHDMLMPGMLSDEELARLNHARGEEFDRLFLQFMIKHHEGAIAMVDQLFKADGAAQDETVFRFAADVHADQTSEIAVMKQMLGREGE
jgi:uncharacterized protein (DUF305 family)